MDSSIKNGFFLKRSCLPKGLYLVCMSCPKGFYMPVTLLLIRGKRKQKEYYKNSFDLPIENESVVLAQTTCHRQR